MFERCFVAVACEKGVRQYGSVMAFAKAIWPTKDEKSAAQTLYSIQGKSNKTGKPQRLKLDEAVRIVELLDGYQNKFPSFCFEVSELLRTGAFETEQIFHTQYGTQQRQKTEKNQSIESVRH